MKYLLLKQLRDFKSNIFLNISVFLIAFFGILFFSGLKTVGNNLDIGINGFYEEHKLASYKIVGKMDRESLSKVRESFCADGATELNTVTIKVGDVNRNAEASLFPYNEFRVNIPEVVSGEMPKNSFDALLDVGFAEANGAKVGDVFSIKIQGSPRDITVCGLARFPDHLYKGEAIPELEETGVLKIFVDFDLEIDTLSEIDTLYVYSELDEHELKSRLSEITGLNYDNALFLGIEENISVTRVRADIRLINSLVSILPIICLIALCLILYVNMSKRIEDDNYTIGVLSANGMKKSSIAIAYCLPYLIWILIGGVLGAALGVIFLPSVYISVLKRFYTLPDLPSVGVFGSIALPLSILVVVTLMALIIAIIGIMPRSPSQLMRGRTKKSVKAFNKIRLPLTVKLSLRNFLSYKKKSLFTIISATLCLALLFTSFLLDNSVDNLQETVYGKYYNYDTTISWNAGDGLKYDDIKEAVNSSELFDKTMYCLEFPAAVFVGDEQKNIMVSIIDEEDPCYNLFIGDEVVQISDGGVYIPTSYGQIESIELKVYGLEQNSLILPVAGSFTDMGLFGVVATKSFTQNNKDFVEFAIRNNQDFAKLNTTVYAKKKEGVFEDRVKEFVNELEKKYEAAFMYEQHNVNSDKFKQLFKVLDITELVLFVICGIMMILLILNISCLSISDRIKDYTIFKALGVGTKRINFLNSLENYFSILIAFILSLPVGMMIVQKIIVGVTLITGVAVYLHFYFYSIIILFVGAALFASISNIFINRKISKVSIVDTLKIKE